MIQKFSKIFPKLVFISTKILTRSSSYSLSRSCSKRRLISESVGYPIRKYGMNSLERKTITDLRGLLRSPMRRSTSYNGFKIVNEVRFSKKEIQYGELFLQNPFLTSYNLDGKHNIIEIENKWLILTSIVLYFQSSKMKLVYLWVDQSIIK